MPPEWVDSFEFQLAAIERMAPKYVWGGSESPEKGLDCSGYLYLAAKWAGIPGVRRTTSERMSKGLDGWKSVEIGLSQAGKGHLAFWTMKPERPAGHVGAFTNPKDEEYKAVYHASSSYGRVVRKPLDGVLLEKLEQVRELTIGD